MTPSEMKNLQPGDVVRPSGSGIGYIVTANYHHRITAVRTVDITNPAEWNLVTKVRPVITPLNADPVGTKDASPALNAAFEEARKRLLLNDRRIEYGYSRPINNKTYYHEFDATGNHRLCTRDGASNWAHYSRAVYFDGMVAVTAYWGIKERIITPEVFARECLG